jgi:hypothetical protein
MSRAIGRLSQKSDGLPGPKKPIEPETRGNARESGGKRS